MKFKIRDLHPVMYTGPANGRALGDWFKKYMRSAPREAKRLERSHLLVFDDHFHDSDLPIDVPNIRPTVLFICCVFGDFKGSASRSYEEFHRSLMKMRRKYRKMSPIQMLRSSMRSDRKKA